MNILIFNTSISNTFLIGFTSRRGCVFLSQILFNAYASLFSQYSFCHYECPLGHPSNLHPYFPGTPTLVSAVLTQKNQKCSPWPYAVSSLFLLFLKFIFCSEILLSNGRDKNCTYVVQSLFIFYMILNLLNIHAEESGIFRIYLQISRSK